MNTSVGKKPLENNITLLKKTWQTCIDNGMIVFSM